MVGKQAYQLCAEVAVVADAMCIANEPDSARLDRGCRAELCCVMPSHRRGFSVESS